MTVEQWKNLAKLLAFRIIGSSPSVTILYDSEEIQ